MRQVRMQQVANYMVRIRCLKDTLIPQLIAVCHLKSKPSSYFPLLLVELAYERASEPAFPPTGGGAM